MRSTRTNVCFNGSLAITFSTTLLCDWRAVPYVGFNGSLAITFSTTRAAAARPRRPGKFQWLTRHNLLYNARRMTMRRLVGLFQWLTRHNLLYNHRARNRSRGRERVSMAHSP